MGDRRTTEIKTPEGSVYFYTHWSGRVLPSYAREALLKAAPRRGNTPYATRIVVDQLIYLTGCRDEETGAGLSLAPTFEDSYNSNKPSVIVDLMAWTVTVYGYDPADEPAKSNYGYCPTCGAPGVERERRLNGNDTCTNGHVYPSAKALDVPRT